MTRFPRDRKLSIRVREHEHAALERAAERSRMTLAEFCRSLLLSSVRRAEAEDREEIAAERESARSPS